MKKHINDENVESPLQSDAFDENGDATAETDFCSVLDELTKESQLITLEQNEESKVDMLACFEAEEMSNGMYIIKKLKNKKELFVEVPECVQAIGDEAFAESDVIGVRISEGLVKIGSRAFANCSDLSIMNLPKSLRIIGEEAFVNCSKLEIEVLQNVQTGKDAYKNTLTENKKAEEKHQKILQEITEIDEKILELEKAPQDDAWYDAVFELKSIVDNKNFVLEIHNLNILKKLQKKATAYHNRKVEEEERLKEIAKIDEEILELDKAPRNDAWYDAFTNLERIIYSKSFISKLHNSNIFEELKKQAKEYIDKKTEEAIRRYIADIDEKILELDKAPRNDAWYNKVIDFRSKIYNEYLSKLHNLNVLEELEKQAKAYNDKKLETQQIAYNNYKESIEQERKQQDKVLNDIVSKLNVGIGDVVHLGKYPQDNEEELEDIEWIVLEKDDYFGALLISKKILFAFNAANDEDANIAMQDFMKKAFAPTELKYIKTYYERYFRNFFSMEELAKKFSCGKRKFLKAKPTQCCKKSINPSSLKSYWAIRHKEDYFSPLGYCGIRSSKKICFIYGRDESKDIAYGNRKIARCFYERKLMLGMRPIIFVNTKPSLQNTQDDFLNEPYGEEFETVTTLLTGYIEKVFVKKDQRVEKGDKLMTVKFLGTEHEIIAPKSGFVYMVNVNCHEEIAAGKPLCYIWTDLK